MTDKILDSQLVNGANIPSADQKLALNGNSSLNATNTVVSSDQLAGKANDNAVVHLAGDETISNTKTFTLAPVLSSTTASQLLATDANKKPVSTTALPNGTTATTQAATDASTKVTTTLGSKIDNSLIYDQIGKLMNGTQFYLGQTEVVPLISGTKYGALSLVSNMDLATSNSFAGGVGTSNIILGQRLFQLGNSSNFVDGINATKIAAGTPIFKLWVNTSPLNNSTTFTGNVYKVTHPAQTVTLTGSGDFRTLTASSGIFISGDASSDVAISSYIRTSNGLLLRVTAFTSATVVTVECTSFTTNFSSLTFELLRIIYTGNTVITDNYFSVTYPSFREITWVASNSDIPYLEVTMDIPDTLAVAFFAKLAFGSGGVGFAIGGTNQYSSVILPPITFVDSLLSSNNIWTGTNQFTQPVTLTGGVKDANVTTAINVGDVTNTAFITNNKTIVGSVNETETDCINIRQDIGQLTSGTNSFYFDYSERLGTSVENAIEMRTLTNNPDGTTEATYNVGINSSVSPSLIEAYEYNDTLNKVALSQGVSAFKAWASVNALTGTTELVANFRKVSVIDTATLTITGTGTSRTATASSSAFLATDDNVSPLLATYIRTPKGLYQITAYTSSTGVTITVPSGYVNESSVAFSKHTVLFDISTGNITHTSLQEVTGFSSVNPLKSLLASDTVSVFLFAKTTSGSLVTIDFRFNGQNRYSHIELPAFTQLKSHIILPETNTVYGGSRRSRDIGASGNFSFNFAIPKDCKNLIAAYLICYPSAGAAGTARNIDLTVNYNNKLVESANQYTASNTSSTYNLTAYADNRYQLNFSALLSNALAGAEGGLEVTHNVVGGTISYTALVIEYTT